MHQGVQDDPNSEYCCHLTSCRCGVSDVNIYWLINGYRGQADANEEVAFVRDCIFK